MESFLIPNPKKIFTSTVLNVGWFTIYEKSLKHKAVDIHQTATCDTTTDKKDTSVVFVVVLLVRNKVKKGKKLCSDTSVSCSTVIGQPPGLCLKGHSSDTLVGQRGVGGETSGAPQSPLILLILKKSSEAISDRV